MEKNNPLLFHTLSGICVKGAHVAWVDGAISIYPRHLISTEQRTPTKKQLASPLAFSAL